MRSKALLEKYRSAIKAWLAGVAGVVFPCGTQWMRRFARVSCEAAEEPREPLVWPIDVPMPT